MTIKVIKFWIKVGKKMELAKLQIWWILLKSGNRRKKGSNQANSGLDRYILSKLKIQKLEKKLLCKIYKSLGKQLWLRELNSMRPKIRYMLFINKWLKFKINQKSRLIMKARRTSLLIMDKVQVDTVWQSKFKSF